VTTRTTVGVETTLTLTTDYTVTGVGETAGGTIVLVAGNLASGIALTIRRVRPFTQTTDIRNQGEFYAETHENEFDHEVMLVQQLKDSVDRCFKLKETEAGTAAKTEFPVAADRVSKYLAFDASGNPVATTHPNADTTRNGIVSGYIKEQAAPDRTLAMVSLVVSKSGVATAIANANLTFTTNTSGNPRVDLVQFSGTTISVKAGTAGASPVCPAPDTGYIPVAVAFLPNAYTAIYNIGTEVDAEGVVIAFYTAANGLYAHRHDNEDIGISSATYVLLESMYLPVYINNAGFNYKIDSAMQAYSVFPVATCTHRTVLDYDGAGINHHFGFVTLPAAASGSVSYGMIPLSTVGIGGELITAGPHSFSIKHSTTGSLSYIGERTITVREIR